MRIFMDAQPSTCIDYENELVFTKNKREEIFYITPPVSPLTFLKLRMVIINSDSFKLRRFLKAVKYLWRFC